MGAKEDCFDMGRRVAESTRIITARPTLRQRISEIWRFRELLLGLVRKELKVKYKNSALGFLWSMLNPALYLVVFYVVFQVFLGSGIDAFPIFLLSGLLVWNLYSTALPGACGAVVGNAALVKKVYFPREILALAAVGAALVHFFLQGIVLVGALVIFRYPVSPTYCLLIPVALLALLLLSSAIGIFLAAVNVYVRDSQHLLELVLLAWFWMTPIVYQYRLVSDKLQEHGLPGWLPLLNPVTPITLAFQRAIYNKVDSTHEGTIIHVLPAHEGMWWYLSHLLVVIGISGVLIMGALSVFGRLEANFAEEL
jgi:ABC-2 type transport system permease protein